MFSVGLLDATAAARQAALAPQRVVGEGAPILKEAGAEREEAACALEPPTSLL